MKMTKSMLLFELIFLVYRSVQLILYISLTSRSYISLQEQSRHTEILYIMSMNNTLQNWYMVYILEPVKVVSS